MYKQELAKCKVRATKNNRFTRALVGEPGKVEVGKTSQRTNYTKLRTEAIQFERVGTGGEVCTATGLNLDTENILLLLSMNHNHSLRDT